MRGVRALRDHARRVRASGRAGRDTGLSLTELLVTMVLFSIVTTIVVSTFMATSDSVQRSVWRQDNTRLSQTGMDTLTKSVRAGTKIERSGQTALPAFTVATPTSIELYSFLGTRPMRLTYTVDASGRLMETRLPADTGSVAPFWTFTGSTTTRIVIDRVVNTAAQPLFVYRDGLGDPFVPIAGNTASLDAVRSVDIRLVVQAQDQNRVPPAVVEQRVHLPNLGSIG